MFSLDTITKTQIAASYHNNTLRKTEVLSQDEIDQLLTAINANDEGPTLQSFNSSKEKIEKLTYKHHKKINEDFAEEAKINDDMMYHILNEKILQLNSILNEQEIEMKKINDELLRLRKIVHDNELFD